MTLDTLEFIFDVAILTVAFIIQVLGLIGLWPRLKRELYPIFFVKLALAVLFLLSYVLILIPISSAGGLDRLGFFLLVEKKEETLVWLIRLISLLALVVAPLLPYKRASDVGKPIRESRFH
jgi:hypothetical protein